MVEKVSRFIFCLIFVGGLAGWSSLESEDREILLRDYKESDYKESDRTHPDSRYFRKDEIAGQKDLIRRSDQGVSRRSYLTTQQQSLFFRPKNLESRVAEDSSHSGSSQAKDSSHSGSSQAKDSSHSGSSQAKVIFLTRGLLRPRFFSLGVFSSC